MPAPDATKPAGTEGARRAFYFNAGFLKQKRVRRIMQLAGYDLSLGKPGPDDLIAVWGHSPYAKRGEAMAEKTGAGIVRVEDAFLRSIFPGRSGSPPLGLVVDHQGAHFDSSRPSDLETLLATHPLDDTALMNRARGTMARLKEAHISKYNAFDPDMPHPEPGYVLVIDQTNGDASVEFGGADANTFREMLYYAQEENPGARIVIKTHPETNDGHRQGYFSADDANDRISLWSNPISPWTLLEGATSVYTVSSQLGFEAIFAGHRPRVFGQPFYAGWGLSDDRHPLSLARRGRSLSRAQLFAASMILYPVWYDPFQDRLCSLETAISTLEAETRCWREDRHGWTGYGMRLWKRRPLQQVFGRHRKMTFRPASKSDTPRRDMVWANKAEIAPASAVRVEDGFLRSRGLGAELVPPLSLVCDDLGIYYDPTRPSRLEQWITRRGEMRDDQRMRAEALIRAIVGMGLTKYNLDGDTPDLPTGHRILVPGQVEDDASIRLGAGEVTTNLALLQATRSANPDAVILYKPHPDVEAGLRTGAVDHEDLQKLADITLNMASIADILHHVDEVWTMTSLTGFEALLRNINVTTTGAPFYAGWGVTTDIGRTPARRSARPDLAGLVHAVLIDYPRYHDPVTGLPCPVEIILDRLAHGTVPHPGAANRALSKLQGLMASYSGIWR